MTPAPLLEGVIYLLKWSVTNYKHYSYEARELPSWQKNYDWQLEERYFEIKRSNGELFTTLDKKDLITFTIDEILTMMSIMSGKFHIVGKKDL